MNVCGKKIRQSAGVFVWSRDSFLILSRRDGYWGLPAGKLEEGESAEQGAKRELFEETGLVISLAQSFRHLGEHTFDFPEWEYVWLFSSFETIFLDRPEISLDTHEHSEFRWITPQRLISGNKQSRFSVFPGLVDLLSFVKYLQ